MTTTPLSDAASSMTADFPTDTTPISTTQTQSGPREYVSGLSSLLTIPAPLKRLFDQFPRRTYPPNNLPERSARLLGSPSRQDHVADHEEPEDTHSLLLWTSYEARTDAWTASFNPTCLTWQTHLLTRKQPISVVSSNNHACSSGSLPLLIPNAKIKGPFVLDVDDVGIDRLEKWAVDEENKKHNGKEQRHNSTQLQQSIWRSLIEGPIRRAWLYHMYLTPNFELLTVPCYIHPQTTQSLVRLELARQLRAAATEELLKHSSKVNEAALYASAKDAFAAFETLLAGDDGSHTSSHAASPTISSKAGSNGKPVRSTPRTWHGLFDTSMPTLVDEMLFTYTFLLLGLDESGWAHDELSSIARRYSGLKAHRDWVLQEGLQGRLQLPSRWEEINKAVR